MEWYSLLLFLHIMALVFWLGTDLGVFVLGKFAQNPSYGIEARLLLLKVAMILDMTPRVSLPISFITGFQLASASGLLFTSPVWSMAVWLFWSLWFLIIIGGLALQTTDAGQRCKAIEKVLLYFVLAGLTFLAFEYFFGAQIIQHFWLAVKVLVFALIILFMLLLEPAFIPAVVGFQRLEIEGSTKEIESSIRASMDKTYLWVIAIYIGVITSAVFGVWKFTF